MEKRECSVFSYISMVALLSVPSALFAATDDFEAFRQQQRQGSQQLSAEFHAYKEKQDAEFADFLKTQWREFETFSGKVRIKEPKPKLPPTVVPAPAAPPALTPAPIVPAIVAPVPVAPPVMAPAPFPAQPKPTKADELEVSFYGNPLGFAFDPQWKNYRLNGAVKPEAMSVFWTMMSGSKYAPTIKAVEDARRTLKLDDWGHVVLWRSIAQALQPGRRAEQNLLLWFFLIKSGYDVRLGYAGADVHLFVAVGQQVYSTKFTTVGQQTYYAVLDADRGDSIRSFYTYAANYPDKLRPLDIRAASVGFTRATPTQRTLAFDFKGQSISLNVSYDRRLVDYVGTFPQTEFPVYFDTDGSSLLRHSLLTGLKKYTANMDDEETVNFLLAFVQKAFAYKTDEAQFGYEKYFFVEESLFFPYSDCEDRAVLFAWLAHELRGIKAVGLLYPGHMSAAVELKQARPEFATVTYRGERFVIADPTYIGASVGMAMPSYAKLKPERVVEIRY